MEKTHYNRALMVQGREELPLPYHNPNEHSNVDDDLGSFTFFENLTLHFIRNNAADEERDRDRNGRNIRIVFKSEGQLPSPQSLSLSQHKFIVVHDLSVHDV